MKPKRILFLVNHDVVIYNFRKEIVEKFLDEGHEVIISSPYGERIDNLIELGCRYIETDVDRHGTNILKDLKLLQFYKDILKKESPDIIFGFTIKPNVYGAYAAKKLKIPFVANITGLGTAVENESLLQKITVLLYKIAFTNIQTVFFQNRENQNFFIKNKIAIGKHKVIPGSGVNLKQFNLIHYPDDNNIEFVFISRIMKQKGIEVYIEAAKIIRQKYPNVKFHVCGFCEENYLSILKENEEKNILTYHGMLRDVRKILRETHCTVHPTFYPEGLSNVLLESAASGRPIITTNRSGTREVVDDGINGFLVQPQNVEDLVDKIEKFITLSYDDKVRMGLNGRKKIEREFDRNVVIQAYLTELESIHA